MQNLFNYTTISTRLEKTTRTLFVTLNRPDWNNAFRLEMLFELESLFAWCTSKVEINSILIDSSTEFFSTGFDYKTLSDMSAHSLEKINLKLQKIIFSMMQLPQTIIIDLGAGCETLASEFSLGADIRIAKSNTCIKFNHSLYGMVPAAGGLSLLSQITSPTFAKHWVLEGAAIDEYALIQSGFITKKYAEKEEKAFIIKQLLTNISLVAPVQRIQSKLGIFESSRAQIEQGMAMDKKIAKASMTSEDWKSRSSISAENNFMPAKSMSYAVKLSLIKSEQTTNAT